MDLLGDVLVKMVLAASTRLAKPCGLHRIPGNLFLSIPERLASNSNCKRIQKIAPTWRSSRNGRPSGFVLEKPANRAARPKQDVKCNRRQTSVTAANLECELPKRNTARVPAPASSSSVPDNNNVEDRLKRVEQMIARLSEAVFPQPGPVLNGIGDAVVSPDATHPGDDSTETHISQNYPKPVEILQDLQSELYGQVATPSEQTSRLDVVSVDILSNDTAIELLRTSIDRYSKWIPLAEVVKFVSNVSQRFVRNSPLLMNVLCLLATRYHPEIASQTVSDIYKHVKRMVADAVIDTPPVTSSVIQAFTLLCLFSPAVQTDKPLDSWHLSAITANHAVIAFGPSNVQQPGAAEERTIEQLRVWGSLCLTHLQYSIGSGRPLTIAIRLMDGCRRLLEQPTIMPFDTPLIAELQFYICLHTALGNPAATPESAFAPWDFAWSRFLTNSGPPRTLELSHWFGHLLLHRRNASSHHDQSPQSAHERNIPSWRESANIVSQFVRDASDRAPDLPDFAFFIASYAALVLCESAIDHHLVDNLRAYLFKVACGESHIAFKHACIIQRALERSRHADVSGEDSTNGGSELSPNTAGTPLPSQSMNLNEFDALAGFDIFGEYFTVGSLL
ncbi:MAG: Protein disulfide-isomerase tigA [Aureobasidium pullulans]|nr:MAG: Protein disulfide-isomerase tigA [Aureobasidium pullulans]